MNFNLQVYIRDPGSYTPIRPELASTGAPQSLILGFSGQKNKDQIAQFSQQDAEKYEEYKHQLEQIILAVDPLLDVPAVDFKTLADSSIGEKLKLLKDNWQLIQSAKLLGPHAAAFYELMTAPTSKILDKWFESEPLKATLATDSITGAMVSPTTPGSGYVLLHHVMGELEGVRGAWGYPEGGMGAVSDALARSAQAHGAQMFTNCPVKEITTSVTGEVDGVVLESGQKIGAKLVLSNATPEITFNRSILHFRLV